jgi:hypothetical protein
MVGRGGGVPIVSADEHASVRAGYDRDGHVIVRGVIDDKRVAQARHRTTNEQKESRS